VGWVVLLQVDDRLAACKNMVNVNKDHKQQFFFFRVVFFSLTQL